jgi:aspartate oxidase
MELFHYQKQACIRLITYLQGLKQFAEHRVDGAGGKEKEKEPPKQEELEEDSADELPESFHRHFGLSKSQKGRDKLCEDVRKLAKKQAMVRTNCKEGERQSQKYNIFKFVASFPWLGLDSSLWRN